MQPRAEPYEAQLDRVRLMAEGITGDWSRQDLEALIAVLQRYEAYAAVVEALTEEAQYDLYAAEVLVALAQVNDLTIEQTR